MLYTAVVYKTLLSYKHHRCVLYYIDNSNLNNTALKEPVLKIRNV